jgi:hypothetical protein
LISSRDLAVVSRAFFSSSVDSLITDKTNDAMSLPWISVKTGCQDAPQMGQAVLVTASRWYLTARTGACKACCIVAAHYESQVACLKGSWLSPEAANEQRNCHDQTQQQKPTTRVLVHEPILQKGSILKV